MTAKTLITVDEFAQMNFGETEDFELVDGELIPLASPTPLHARVRGKLEHLLRSYFERSPIGEAFAEIDCRITTVIDRRPDLSVFLGERRNFDVTRIPAPCAPDIAVEVLSPSEKVLELNRKILDYLGADCQEVWLLDQPNCEIFVHTGTSIRVYKAKDVLGSRLMPGFSVSVGGLLAG